MRLGTVLGIAPIPELLLARVRDYKALEYESFTRGIDCYKIPQILMTYLNANVYEGTWSIQAFHKDLPIHIDKTTTDVRFMYMLELGGENVTTSFYNAAEDSIIQTVKYEKDKWNIIRTSLPHSVDGMEPGHSRVCITAPLLSTPWINSRENNPDY